MPELSIANMPEVFVSNTEITKAVYNAVEAGRLRKIGTPLQATRASRKNLNLLCLIILKRSRNWHPERTYRVTVSNQR